MRERVRLKTTALYGKSRGYMCITHVCVCVCVCVELSLYSKGFPSTCVWSVWQVGVWCVWQVGARHRCYAGPTLTSAGALQCVLGRFGCAFARAASSSGSSSRGTPSGSRGYTSGSGGGPTPLKIKISN